MKILFKRYKALFNKHFDFTVAVFLFFMTIHLAEPELDYILIAVFSGLSLIFTPLFVDWYLSFFHKKQLNN